MSEPRVPRPHVVVTGASTGIGRALARAFAADGADLTLVARRAEPLAALAAELPHRSHVAVHDLSDPARAADFLPAAEEALGPVRVLVNNAGVQVIGPTHEVDLEAAEQSLRINLSSPLALIRAVLPGMRERGGTIVNVTSMAALAPTPGMTWYNASKAGLAGASEALRGELKRTPVRVVTVYPGIIHDTDMARAALDRYQSDRLAVRMQPTGTADQLAAVVVRAVRRGSARVIWPRANALARHFPAATRAILDALTPLPEG